MGLNLMWPPKGPENRASTDRHNKKPPRWGCEEVFFGLLHHGVRYFFTARSQPWIPHPHCF
jgi:hypothetical protein